MKKILALKLAKDRGVSAGAVGWALVDKNEEVEENITRKQVMDKARWAVGAFLKQTREQKGISIQALCKDPDLNPELVRIIESGQRYDIDYFLAYIRALDCYFYLADRKGDSGNIEDLKKKAR